ncbi:4'-phosphopantetheinyl transferase superfamily protein [Gracilinema caldarium]|uniref:4'-phosphopantetheinyl transferase family protein n=1 Tax=Gracilinema caldarium TaxID=215591 RepID=UPI0026EA93C9|nr:hypothetical protein [Gracilinema caldarium]
MKNASLKTLVDYYCKRKIIFINSNTCVFYFNLNKEIECSFNSILKLGVQNISLCERDQLKISSIKNDEARNVFILQRLLLYEVLSIYGQIHYKQKQPYLPDIQVDKNGKLYFKNDSISFNISHSGEQYIIAVGSNTSQIGVDIDTISKIRDPVRYSSILFKDLIIKDPLVLLNTWTIFEAYSKSTGMPLTKLFKSDFSSFAADLASNNKNNFYNNYKFFSFECSHNVIATICEKILR